MRLELDQPPTSLCLIRLSAIGDTCHTVPIVRAIQAAWPATAITWIIGKVEYGLMQALEGIEFVVLDKSRGWRGYFDLRRQLRNRRFPLLLHMHASQRANLASLSVSAPVRLGFDRARGRDLQYYFCNRHIPPRPGQHVMDGMFEFCDAIGVEHSAPRWDIPLAAEDLEFARAAIEADRPSLVISPCTGHRFRNFRNWRVERYAEIADYAASRYGAQVLLTGGRSDIERQYAAGIAAATRCSPVNLIGQTSLKQLLAVIAHAGVVLCPDSGPAHMATAVGTPIVGLYATSNRHRTGPYSSQHLVVDKYPEAVRAEFGVDVDALRFGRRVRNPDAMDRITVADVQKKLDLAFAERDISPLNKA
jgi:heptosyltransferase I